MVMTARLPNDEELTRAIIRTKEYGYSSRDIITSTAAIQYLRHQLGLEFLTLSDDDLRKVAFNFSKSGKEPGKRKRTDEQKTSLCFVYFLNRVLKLYTGSDTHSAEYDRIHRSENYRTLVADLKRRFGYRCQICTRQFRGIELEGHILDYSDWDTSGKLLILCRSECHPVADALRRRGKAIELGEPVPELYTLIDDRDEGFES